MDFKRNRLGKAPARADGRSLRLASVLRGFPPVPEAWDCDGAFADKPPLSMFANDEWADCVIAGRAHQTLRFELCERGKVLPISDGEVLREYWLEQGCPLARRDGGLVVLDSLKRWRKRGWRVGGETLRIYAFAAIHPSDPDEVRAAVCLLNGAGCGLQLPVSAQGQETWDTGGGPGSEAGSWGGHYVYLVGYNPVGPVCVSWGARKQMTWAFLARYSDELFAIVDAPDGKGSLLNMPRLAGYLKELEG